jgi:protein Tob/BTG
MKREIEAVVNIVKSMIKLSNCKLSNKQLVKFEKNLKLILERRFKNHWFPNYPQKSSSFRTIRINDKIDPVLIEAARASKISTHEINCMFCHSIVILVDPGEVSYSINENMFNVYTC